LAEYCKTNPASVFVAAFAKCYLRGKTHKNK